MPQRTPAPSRPRSPHARRVLALLCLLILAPILGCSAIVTDDQAPGTYKADADWGVSTIVISKDHSFSQTVTLKNGQTKQLSGHWKISRNTGDISYTTISLSPFFNITHDKQGQPTAASAYSIYHVPFGGINIAADPDFGIAFRK
jgi:hypothetical protein